MLPYFMFYFGMNAALYVICVSEYEINVIMVMMMMMAMSLYAVFIFFFCYVPDAWLVDVLCSELLNIFMVE
jgi:hypothetical protein